MKKLILLLIGLLLVDLVLAESNLSRMEFITIYNSFTGKQDYVRGYNWSRYNLTFGCIDLNGNKICNWDSVNGTGSSYNDTLVRQSIIDNITSANASMKIYVDGRELLIRNSIADNSTADRIYTDGRVNSINNLSNASIRGLISSGDNNITYSSATGIFKIAILKLNEFDNSISGFITNAVSNLQNYFTKTETNILLADINSTIATKLNTSDQRYNETLRIDALNSTVQSEIINRQGNDTSQYNLINNETSNRVNNDTALTNRDNAINTSANIQNFITIAFLKTLGLNTTTELTALYNTLYAAAQGLFGNTNWTNLYNAQTDRFNNNNDSTLYYAYPDRWTATNDTAALAGYQTKADTATNLSRYVPCANSSNITCSNGVLGYNGSVGSSGGASPFTSVDNKYIYNATGTITFNETKENITIDSRMLVHNGSWNADKLDNLHASDINDSCKLWAFNGTIQLANNTLQNALTAGANITISGTTISVATGLYTNLKNTFDTIYQAIGSYFTKTEITSMIDGNVTALRGNINTNSTYDRAYTDTRVNSIVNTTVATIQGWVNTNASTTLSITQNNVNTNSTYDRSYTDTRVNSITNTTDSTIQTWVNGNYTKLDNRDNAINSSTNIQNFITAVFLRTIGFNDTTALKAYFDTLYTSAQGLFSNTNFTTQYYLIDSRYTDANISGSETAFNNWDKLSSDDYNTNNFSTDYTAQTGRYTDTNFSAKYNLMGAFTNTNFTGLNPFSNTNFSSQYNAQTDRYTNTNGSAQYTAQTGRYTIANLTSDLANNPVNTTKNFNVNLKFNVTASTGIVSMSNNLTGVDCVVFKNGGAICGS